MLISPSFRTVVLPYGIHLVVSTFLHTLLRSNVFSVVFSAFLHGSVRYYCVIKYVIHNIFYVMLDLSSHITDAGSKNYIVARGIYTLQSSILTFLVNVSNCDRRNFQNWQG